MSISSISAVSSMRPVQTSSASLQSAPAPVSSSGGAPVSASGGSFNLKAAIAQGGVALGSLSSPQPTSIESLSLDDIQLLQDAAIYEAVVEAGALVEGSGSEPFTLTVTKDGGAPAEVEVVENES